jgi:type II secretory pathway pseudopilin PulG
MTPVAVGHRRSAYILMVAIGAMGFLLLVAVVLARCATTDIRREQMALLESAAEQALQSARTWSQVHADELARAERVTLCMDKLIWPGVDGAAELSRGQGDDDAPRVNCRLTLQRGRWRVTRQVSWPAPGVPSDSPAVGAAMP